MPDPVILRCPACAHLVRVPTDYLGQTVTCLQCRAAFVAPADPGGSPTVVKRGGVPARLMIPLFGLILFGAAGLLVNGYMWWSFADPAAGELYARRILEQLAASAPPEVPRNPTPEQQAEVDRFRAEQEKLIAERAAEWGPRVRPLRAVSAAVSLGVLAGGLAFLWRRPYWLGFVGSGLAAVTAPDLGCCIPGAVLGLWGFFALISDEGRRYFGKG